MIRWIRVVLTVLAVAGVLAARPGMAAPATDTHQHQHCMGVADEPNCPSHDHGAVPTCCVAAVCAMVQPVFPEQHSVVIPLGFTHVALPMPDDAWRSGVRPPLVLRPPIA